MGTTRQPLLTLSPSQHLQVSPSGHNKEQRGADGPPQTTPTLPRRERLASFSRLLKKDRFSKFSQTSMTDNRKGEFTRCNSKAPLRPSIDVRISPCSPSKKYSCSRADELFMDYEKGYLSPNSLPFSPRLLNKNSPVNLSPSYRNPSPLRSPLYHSDGRRNFLGRGSFGKVSLSRYKGTDFAVKIIHHPSPNIGENNLVGIRHPHLVEIFHISTVLDRTIIFMEFAGYCNLQQILDTKSELDFRRKLSFCIQIAFGLRYCHQHRIVHGDVKPANVMISPMGVCKLGDFGHSTKYDADLDTWLPHPVEDRVGTVAYAAPEVLRGSCPTPQSDVYSFGILLWQVETRQLPFDGEHPHVVIYKVANYGNRPKMPESEDPILLMYLTTIECCWQTIRENRISASQALLNLQNIMQMIKEQNEKKAN